MNFLDLIWIIPLFPAVGFAITVCLASVAEDRRRRHRLWRGAALFIFASVPWFNWGTWTPSIVHSRESIRMDQMPGNANSHGRCRPIQHQWVSC